MIGAYAKKVTGRPTSSLSTASIPTSGGSSSPSRSGSSIPAPTASPWERSRPSCGDVWLSAFNSFSRVAYALSDVITTQYRANQTYQRLDGAPEHKLRIIQNGIDVDLRRC